MIQYDEKYKKQMFDYFNVAHTELGEDDKEKAVALPSFEKFAVMIGVHSDVLKQWADQHADFLFCMKQCQDLQHDMLTDLGLRGLYNSTFATQMIKNKVPVEQTTGETLFYDLIEQKAIGYEKLNKIRIGT